MRVVASFFEGSHLTEPSHLCFLFAALPTASAGGKRLEKLLIGVSGFEHSGKRPLGGVEED